MNAISKRQTVRKQPEYAAFAEAFREHVIPRLRSLAQAEATCITHGVEGFHEAHAVVWRYARKYGALHLPEHLLDQLLDWIAVELLHGVDATEARLTSRGGRNAAR